MSGILSAFGGGSYGSPPANTVAPAVSGTATNGQTLSSTTGTWTGVPTPSFTYQWQRASVNISGATSSTYVLVAADVGSTIRCVVTATNAISAVGANSNSTASVAAAVPGAPTIGTATSTGSTTATVAFTAPASNGGATITSYTAVSSPGSITGTLSQAGSGTITVTGLSGSTAYTFTVYATNSAGNSASSSSSNSITTSVAPPSAIGAAYQGGYYAGSISTTANGVATHYLVVGPNSSAVASKKWKNASTTTSGAQSTIDGPSNTSVMTNSTTFPAGSYTLGLTVGGYSNWYMPAKYELNVIYYNLKPQTGANNTGQNGSPDGSNPYSVPARSAFTSGDPAQTSASAFQAGGAQAFNDNGLTAYYWSSTEDTSYITTAFIGYFGNGAQYSFNKTSTYNVRAVRRVAV